MTRLSVNLVPFPLPDTVKFVVAGNTYTVPIQEISRDALIEMCDAFKASMIKQYGPAQAINEIVNPRSHAQAIANIFAEVEANATSA